MRKTFKDPEFRAEFRKLVTNEVSPLMPVELAKVIREMPRDPEVVEMLKKFSESIRYRRTKAIEIKTQSDTSKAHPRLEPRLLLDAQRSL